MGLKVKVIVATNQFMKLDTQTDSSKLLVLVSYLNESVEWPKALLDDTLDS